MLRDQRLGHEAAGDEVLLNDPLEDWRIAPGVPRAFRIDDRDRSAFANAQAVGLRAENAALLGQTELLRRRPVSGDRRCGHDRGAREIPFASEPHAVLPIAIERRDRALAGVQRVGPLPEARTAPALTNLPAHRTEHAGDRFAVEPR